MSAHFKDEILDRLARRVNVAQFVSFGPDLGQRFAWIRSHEPNSRFASLDEAIGALLAASPEGRVNIRCYEPDNPKSREFLYGQGDREEVAALLRRLGGEGLYTIVNETVDIEDGGVSGVAYGGALEFAPGDTPRAVEKPGTASFPRALGLRVLETVYGFAPSLPARTEQRVEWSLHPLRRGVLAEHTIIWEVENAGPPPGEVRIAWPNRFSRHLGDKAFGLVLAHAVGLPVPKTLALPRALPPFSFGTDTGSQETWLRTCPHEQVPGFFPTRRGWTDPYRLMQEHDPSGDAIASILAQQGVEARFSGALVATPEGDPVIEGVAGRGDDFMIGRKAPEELPHDVAGAVRSLFHRASTTFGAVRFEWAYDGARPWVLQMHRGATLSIGRTIVPGTARAYRHFDVEQGIDALRRLIEEVQGNGDGIVLIGRVGVTSHFGDLLRRAQIPSRIEEPGE